jgi:hypothetical protein
LWERVVTIFFTAAGLVVLNLYPQIIGFNFPQADGWISIPVLSPAFFRLLPLINLSGALTIVVHMLLFRQGRWQMSTRWLSLAQQSLGAW